MMITRGLWIVAAALAGSLAMACASSSSQSSWGAEKVDVDDDGVAQARGDEDGEPVELRCRVERPTGSNIARRVCRTPAQVNRHARDRRERDQQHMRDASRYGCEGQGCTPSD